MGGAGGRALRGGGERKERDLDRAGWTGAGSTFPKGVKCGPSLSSRRAAAPRAGFDRTKARRRLKGAGRWAEGRAPSTNPMRAWSPPTCCSAAAWADSLFPVADTRRDMAAQTEWA